MCFLPRFCYRGVDPETTIDPNPGMASKNSHFLATCVMASAWWWITWHMLTEPGHVFVSKGSRFQSHHHFSLAYLVVFLLGYAKNKKMLPSLQILVSAREYVKNVTFILVSGNLFRILGRIEHARSKSVDRRGTWNSAGRRRRRIAAQFKAGDVQMNEHL